MQMIGRADAWMIPQLQTFKGAERVHFSRAEGCTLSDAELMAKIEGTVMWTVSIFNTHEQVTDVFGVEHRPMPLYLAAPTWQPIETAPKDNKRPLLIARFNNDGTLQNIDYNASYEQERESWEIPQLYWVWMSENGNVEEPTHWMYQPDWYASLTHK